MHATNKQILLAARPVGFPKKSDSGWSKAPRLHRQKGSFL